MTTHTYSIRRHNPNYKAALWHAVRDDAYYAVCGSAPRGERDWDVAEGDTVTCPKCLEKMSAEARATARFTTWRVYADDDAARDSTNPPILGTVKARNRDDALNVARARWGRYVWPMPLDKRAEAQISAKSISTS